MHKAVLYLKNIEFCFAELYYNVKINYFNNQF